MITVDKLVSNIKRYVDYQIDSLSINNPMINFIKPLITRAVDKSIGKVHTAMNLITDEEGNIDVDSIIDEIIGNMLNTKPFTVNNSFIGDIIIGDGEVKLNIPFTNKRLVLNKSDLETLKEMLTRKD